MQGKTLLIASNEGLSYNMLPIKWRIFKVICMIQMLLAIIEACETIFIIFLGSQMWLLNLFEIVVFLNIIFFTSLALSILNNNYPDEPIMDTQKTRFNQQYILNFFGLALLLAFLITDIRRFIFLLSFGFDKQISILWLLRPSIFFFALTINQVIILVGMVKLRRELLRHFYEQASQITNT